MADFELASRLNIMFATPAGSLSLNDLWELPLQSTRGRPNLDDIAKGLNTQIEGATGSFVEEKKAPAQRLVVAFECVKRVIEWRLEDNKRKSEESAKAETKRQLLEALADKRQEGIRSLSEEELIARINAL